MDIAEIMECFSHKCWTWRRAFCNFFLLRHNLYAVKLKAEIEPEMLAQCCRNEGDLQEMWRLANYLDDNEEEMLEIIGDYRYFRPIPWQYDFVEQICEKSKQTIPQTLHLDALTDAYCVALFSDRINLPELTRQLDETYLKLYGKAAHKQELLKRNFSLTLETLGHRRWGDRADGLNFRELVEAYLPDCREKGIVKALQQAETAELKLSSEERAALGFAYYSPFFLNTAELQKGKTPKSSIFSCVEERLKIEREYRKTLNESRYRAQSEDEEDNIDDALANTHNAVFVDPQEKCLIDTRYGDVLYANVYIERTPEDFLNNSLPDFIRYHKGCLYTVEFVDDIRRLEVAQEMLQRLNDINRKMLMIERQLLFAPDSDWARAARQKYAELYAERATCFYICN